MYNKGMLTLEKNCKVWYNCADRTNFGVVLYAKKKL